METKIIDIQSEYDLALDTASEIIREGGLVAFPTETVYGLGADAFNARAVEDIFKAKGRPQDNPLIVHICDKDQIDELAFDIPDIAKELTEDFWPGPFTVILKKRPCVPDIVTAGLDTVAIRFPSNAFAHDLILKSGRFIAAPSANSSGRPSPTSAAHVKEDLMGKIPLIVDGGRCTVGVESTVCMFKGDRPVILRPGGITAEMIKDIAGRVEIHDAVLGDVIEEKPASPGMKYKHYAPKAEVEVFVGDEMSVAKEIDIRYNDYDAESIVFCLEGQKRLYTGKRVRSLGKDHAAAARTLFAALREADSEGIKKILFHGVSNEDEGLAVMNRIIRAAGHNVTIVPKEENIG
ncbi:MAG: threonylcarbamoyl-AMP synthase [Christensenellaceae bacterium]|nr:threonylcarbamoyl-AMP synthase [Christensenellaceae bacterium]